MRARWRGAIVPAASSAAMMHGAASAPLAPNPTARDDADERVRAFLRRHLGHAPGVDEIAGPSAPTGYWAP